MIWQTAPLKPQIDAGSVKPIAALTAKRIRGFEDVPTVGETLLPGFDSSAWFGVLAPAGTPNEVVDRLAAALAKGLRDEQLQARLRDLAVEPETIGPDEFQYIIASDLARWQKVINSLK